MSTTRNLSPSGRRGHQLAERYQDRLHKASIGKSCIRFKRPGDLDQEVLEGLLRRVAELAPRAPDRAQGRRYSARRLA
jgi:hypothetical protein